MSAASVQTGTSPRSISVDLAGRFAFVANYTTNNVSVYAIDAVTRALTEVLGSPFPAGTSPTAVKVDSSGRFLYVSNYGFPGSGTVSAYMINATTGALAAISGSPFVASNGSSSIDIDASGRFVYATNLLNDTISMFSIDPTSGVLTKIQDLSVTNARPISITADPTGRFIYVATACGTNWVFSINATSGLLSRVDAAAGGLCFGSPGAPDIAAIDPSGSHLYTGDFSMGNDIGAFDIDAIAGTVTPVTGSPFATGSGTLSVTVDQSGNYAYVTGSAGVYAFKIGSSGALSALPGGVVAAGSSPISITTVSSVQ
jgi:6-phosphogluconolactonase (cycloisomerase 2 family)